MGSLTAGSLEFPRRRASALTIPIIRARVGEESRFTCVATTWAPDLSISASLPTPVYKTAVDGVEEVCYNSRHMVPNELYKIEINGEPWALRRTDREVEFLRFVPDEQ